MESKKINMTIHDSISRSIIMIDEQNLNVFITRYTSDIKKQTDYVGYLIACLTVILALITSNFHDFLGFKAEVWQAVFFISAMILGFMTFKTAYNAWKTRNITPESLIEKIKASGLEQKETKEIDFKPF